jgi:transposase-like protein
MNTPNPDIQMPVAGRRRGRYSLEFKHQVVAACLEPAVSTAAIALANGLNANMVRRWVVESARHNKLDAPQRSTALAATQLHSAFIPIKFAPVPPTSTAPPTDIRIELQHGTTGINIHWPMAASNQCAQWLREVLA